MEVQAAWIDFRNVAFLNKFQAVWGNKAASRPASLFNLSQA